MTFRYLLDTDWVIHYLHGRHDIVERVHGLSEQGIALSTVSLAELYEGVSFSSDPSGNESALQDFFVG